MKSFATTFIDNDRQATVTVTITAPTAGAALGIIDRSYQYPQYVRMGGFSVDHWDAA
jgi:hypothetical protein